MSWSPADLGASLLYWFRAGAGAYQDEAGTNPCAAAGDPVALWQDQSGNGHHLTVFSGDAAPLYNPTVGYFGSTNGGTFPNANPFLAPSITFDGSTQAMYNAAYHGTANTATAYTVAASGRALGGGNGGPTVGLENGTFDALHISRGGGAAYYSSLASGGGGSYAARPDAGRACVFAYDPSKPTFAGQGRLYEYGAAQTVSGSYYPDAGSIGAGLWVGRDALFVHYFCGAVGELVGASRALSDAEALQLANYLAAPLRTGFSHLYCVGDSITKGYPSNQNDDPAALGGGADSYPLTLWDLLGGHTPASTWSTYDGGNVAYTVGTYDGSPGSISTISSLLPSARDPWSAADVAIYQGGTNDIAGARTDAQLIADLQGALTPLMAAGFTRVVLWTVTPRGDWPIGTGPYGGIDGGTWSDGMEAYRLSVNSWIRASAVAGGFCHAVYDPEAQGFGDPNGALFEPDKLHFNTAGNALHAANLAPIVSPPPVTTARRAPWVPYRPRRRPTLFGR